MTLTTSPISYQNLVLNLLAAQSENDAMNGLKVEAMFLGAAGHSEIYESMKAIKAEDRQEVLELAVYMVKGISGGHRRGELLSTIAIIRSKTRQILKSCLPPNPPNADEAHEYQSLLWSIIKSAKHTEVQELIVSLFENGYPLLKAEGRHKQKLCFLIIIFWCSVSRNAQVISTLATSILDKINAHGKAEEMLTQMSQLPILSDKRKPPMRLPSLDDICLDLYNPYEHS